jgi:uncharacterized protein
MTTPTPAPDDPLPKIQADAVTALKAGDKDRVRVLRMLAAELKRAAIDGGTDFVVGADAVAVLRRAVKTRTDSVEQFEKAGRKDLADKERVEIAIVSDYLPRGPSDDEVRAVARTVIAEKAAKGPQAMGLVMKETLARLAGAADGKTVSRIVAELLRA